MPIDVVTYDFASKIPRRLWRRRSSEYEVSYAWVVETEIIPRYGAGAVKVGSSVYVIGGCTERGVSSAIEKYDVSTGERSFPAYLPEPLAHFACGLIGGKVYVAGGVGSDYVPRSKVYEYDPSSNNVTQKAFLPKCVAYCSSSVLGGKLYVVGGIDDAGNILKDVYAYDPSSNTVSTLPQMSYARQNSAVAELGGKLYCFGGDNGSDRMSVIEVYDPSSNVWQTLTVTLPEPLSAMGSQKVLINGVENIIIVGG